MNGHEDGSSISAYMDGALAAAERERVDAHLSSCASCRAELESLRHLKMTFFSAARKTLPPDLALSLERRFTAEPWHAALTRPVIWAPVGAVGLAALVVSLWLRSTAALEELPLEPLLAAHARYSAEALMPEDNLVASNYSDQMTESDAPDTELE